MRPALRSSIVMVIQTLLAMIVAEPDLERVTLDPT